jgi:hypothetical protein
MVKKLISISLALLMLVSNLGFAMNTHYCGGEAVKTSFTIGLHNPNCGMPDMDEKCQVLPLSEAQLKPKPCCENQHQLVHLDDIVDFPSSNISFNPTFTHAFVKAFLQPISTVEQTFIRRTDFLHALPDKELEVLFQSFLI